ncbi:MAG: hypothetical protein J2P23_13400 [Microlunatus sp.]|nr:hypothetical protein [Microlunatus sp.]
MTRSPDTPQDAVRRISSDHVLGRLLAGVAPDPGDQSRLFRARWRADGSPCVLKVGLGDLEARWMPAMAASCDDVVPAIRRHGTTIGDHDQPWLIMADLPYRGRSDDLESAHG